MGFLHKAVSVSFLSFFLLSDMTHIFQDIDTGNLLVNCFGAAYDVNNDVRRTLTRCGQ